MSMVQKIIKSSSDLRQYKAITLKNKLQCLLVSDEKADKSAAAMNVNVGHLSDPIDRQGLAHFLEHMLFMGTEKYPNQSEYSDYLAKNGGGSNAYTSSLETNYYFKCSNAGLEGALDRFSQFFSHPLFTETCVEKEMNAVNSEHQKNLMQDTWRINQLFRSSALPNNEFCKFGTGDLTTLSHPSIRTDLIEFYNRFYSANLMRLVVVSNEQIPTLEEWIQTNFGEIPNRDLLPPSFAQIPFSKENLGSIWKITPVKDIHKLSLKWIIPYLKNHYRNSPGSYISHLLGHEGEHSLLSILFNKGYALDLSAGPSDEMNSWSMMSIEIGLTNKGLKHYEDVLEIVFAYVEMIKRDGIKQWVFEEQKLLSELNFANKDKEGSEGYALSLASRMQYYPIEDVLVQPYLNEAFDEALISQIMQEFTVDNVRINLISKSFESECNLVEPIYQTKYTFAPIPSDLRQRLVNPNPDIKDDIRLINRNEFLPKNMELFAKEFENLPKHPHLIRKEENSEVWFKLDGHFKKPKAILKVRIDFPEFTEMTRTKILFSLWNNLLKERMREITYMAEMAYLACSVTPREGQIDLSVGGYNDSLASYTIQLFEIIASFKCTDKSLFDIQFEKMMRNYANIQKAQPYQIILNYCYPFLLSNGVNPDELAPTLDGITFEDFLKFQETFSKKMRFQWLVQGNLEETAVKELTQKAEQILLNARNAKGMPVSEIQSIRAIQHVKNQTYFWEKKLEEHETNSAIVISFQNEYETLQTGLQMDFLSQILKTPCFDVLRTNEQLGYVVQSSAIATQAVLGFVFLIQSNIKPPQYLATRIDAFINGYQEKILALTEEEFQQHKASLISNLKQQHKSVFEEGNHNWQEVTNNTFVFDKKEQKLIAIEAVTIEQVQKLFKELFFETKKRFEVHFISKTHEVENEQVKEQRMSTENIKQITSISGFRSSCSLYPDYYAKL